MSLYAVCIFGICLCMFLCMIVYDSVFFVYAWLCMSVCMLLHVLYDVLNWLCTIVYYCVCVYACVWVCIMLYDLHVCLYDVIWCCCMIVYFVACTNLYDCELFVWFVCMICMSLCFSVYVFCNIVYMILFFVCKIVYEFVWRCICLCMIYCVRVRFFKILVVCLMLYECVYECVWFCMFLLFVILWMSAYDFGLDVVWCCSIVCMTLSDFLLLCMICFNEFEDSGVYVLYDVIWLCVCIIFVWLIIRLCMFVCSELSVLLCLIVYDCCLYCV